jgi:hypothetical protein
MWELFSGRWRRGVWFECGSEIVGVAVTVGAVARVRGRVIRSLWVEAGKGRAVW